MFYVKDDYLWFLDQFPKLKKNLGPLKSLHCVHRYGQGFSNLPFKQMSLSDKNTDKIGI